MPLRRPQSLSLGVLILQETKLERDPNVFFPSDLKWPSHTVQFVPSGRTKENNMRSMNDLEDKEKRNKLYVKHYRVWLIFLKIFKKIKNFIVLKFKVEVL
jgi:hypothetical protein